MSNPIDMKTIEGQKEFVEYFSNLFKGLEMDSFYTTRFGSELYTGKFRISHSESKKEFVKYWSHLLGMDPKEFEKEYVTACDPSELFDEDAKIEFKGATN